MRFTRIAVSVAAVMAMLTLGAAAAQAQQYPVQQGNLQVNDTTVTPGQPVVISGDGCAPNSQVVITFDTTVLATINANGQGAFSTTVTIPSDASNGQHTLRASCTTPQGGARVLSASLTVSGQTAGSTTTTSTTAAPTTTTTAAVGGTGLPRTGASSTAPLTAAGIGLVAAGSVAVVASRRRRRTTRTAA